MSSSHPATPHGRDDKLFVGRGEDIERLSGWLRGEGSVERLRVISISGPGGIGKSLLLEEALRRTDLSCRGYLTLRLSARVAKRSLTDMLTGELVKSATPLDARENRFVLAQRCRRVAEDLGREVRRDLEAAAKGDARLAKTVAELFSLGVDVLELLRLAHPAIAVAAKLGAALDPADVERVVKLALETKAMAQESPFLNGILGDAFDRGLRNRLRDDLEKTLAECIVHDLDAMLKGDFSHQSAKLLRRKAKGLDRLLLVLDDYESFPKSFGRFLMDELMPLLARASFESVVVVLGREQLTHSDEGWQHRFDRNLVGKIRVPRLPAADAEHYVRSRGIVDDAVVHRLVTETEGFPFMLASEVDAQLDGGRSALGLKLFFDRTTYAMSPEQRGWLMKLCFLERINLETIELMIPGESPAEILEWFKNEASCRSADTERGWEVIPIVRSATREYLRNDSPKLHGEYLARAAATGSA